MVSARSQFEAACQLQKFAGLAQWKCRELVPLRRVFDSLDQLQISMAGLAEWLSHWIVAPVTRVRFSHLAPIWAVRIRGLPTACNREMRVQVSHRPPGLARELDGRVLGGARLELAFHGCRPWVIPL